MPGAKARGGVSTQDQEKLLVVRECLESLDRIRQALPDHLSVVGLESSHVGHGETGHLQSMRVGGDPAAEFLPRVASRHEEHAVEPQLVEGALTGVQVGDVDGVERPTENAGTHAGEDRAWAARPAGVPC